MADSLQKYLDKWLGTKAGLIAPKFIQAMDDVAGPIIQISYGTAPAPPLNTHAALVPAVMTRLATPNPGVTSPSPVPPIAATFLTAIVTDVSQITLYLAAGAAAVPLSGVGIPAGPISPAAMLPLILAGGASPDVGKAILEWAVSLMTPGDIRVAGIMPTVA